MGEPNDQVSDCSYCGMRFKVLGLPHKYGCPGLEIERLSTENSDLVEEFNEEQDAHRDTKMQHEAALERIKELLAEVQRIRVAAEYAYSEIAFAVHDLAGRRLTNDEAIDSRSSKLSKCADNLRATLDASDSGRHDQDVDETVDVPMCVNCGGNLGYQAFDQDGSLYCCPSCYDEANSPADSKQQDKRCTRRLSMVGGWAACTLPYEHKGECCYEDPRNPKARGPFFQIEHSHEAVDAFWRAWKDVGEPHIHGVYESTWMGFRAAMLAGGRDQSAADDQRQCPHGIKMNKDCPSCDRYPCAKCEKPRTKAEGGTTFSVCDDCWDTAARRQEQ